MGSLTPIAGLAGAVRREFDTVGQITSVSCAAGTSFCAAVDLGGNAFIYNGGSWSAAASLEPAPTSHKGHDGLSSVSCASSSFCVAVDGLGNAFTDNGSTWSAAVKIDSSTQTTAVCSSGDQFCYGLASVSCASAAFCVALDNNGDVLTLGGPSGSVSADGDRLPPLRDGWNSRQRCRCGFEREARHEGHRQALRHRKVSTRHSKSARATASNGASGN